MLVKKCSIKVRGNSRLVDLCVSGKEEEEQGRETGGGFSVEREGMDEMSGHDTAGVEGKELSDTEE